MRAGGGRHDRSFMYALASGPAKAAALWSMRGMSTPTPTNGPSANPAAARAPQLESDPQRSTLRMSRQELETLRADLDATNGPDAQARREFMRWPFDRLVRVELFQPGGVATPLTFACRNISRGGISLLHRAYVYPSTKCLLTLPHPTAGTIAITGVVRRCRHYKGSVHEIGVKFDRPCNVRELLGLGQADRCYLLERVDPQKITGTALLIEDSEMDRVIVRQALADTNMSVTASDTGAAGIERARDGFDVILCSMELPDMSGIEALEKLRAAGIHAPFVLISGDNTQAVRDAVKTAKTDGFLTRPLNRDGLLSVLGEILLLPGEESGGQSPLYSNLPDESPMLPHVPAYVSELRVYSDRLKEAIEKQDATVARRITMQIKGSAPVFGFETLGRIADVASTALAASMSVEESLEPLNRLTAACQRARVQNKRDSDAPKAESADKHGGHDDKHGHGEKHAA